MRDRVEVLGKIRVDHIGVAGAEPLVDLSDGVHAASSRTVAKGAGVEIRLEDRLENQLGRGLHHSVPKSWHTYVELHFRPNGRWARLKSPIRSTRFAASGLSS